MKLTFEALHILQAIVRHGSFAAAADELNKVRSALTYTVKKLEDDLGIKIFDRSGHRAKLTDLGEYLLRESQSLLSSAQDLERNVLLKSRGWESQLTISVDELIPFERFFPLIERFQKDCPTVDLSFYQERLSGCWDALWSGRASLAIGVSGDAPRNVRIGMEPLGMLEMVFAIAPQHPLAGLDELSEEDIKQYRAVIVRDTAKVLPKRDSGLYLEQRTITVDSMQAKLDLQLKGLAIGYLPRLWAEPYLKSGHLKEKKVPKLKEKFFSSIAWRRDSQGKALEWWIQNLKEAKEKQVLLE